MPVEYSDSRRGNSRERERDSRDRQRDSRDRGPDYRETDRSRAPQLRGGYDDRERGYRRDDGDTRRDDLGRRGALPPPPPNRPSSSGRQQGTPPKVDRRERDEGKGGTPGSHQARRSGPAGASNPVLAELLKHSKQVYGEQRPGDGRKGEDDDMEAGELPASGGDGEDNGAAGASEQGQRKRKHAPIVWSLDEEGEVPDEEPRESRGPPNKRPASVPASGGSIFDRVAQEAAEFKQRQEELGYDPDAPAAMKASPSVSGSRSGGEDEGGAGAGSSPVPRERRQDAAYSNGNGRQAASGEGSGEEDEDMAEARPAGLASRWLAAGDSDEEGQGAAAAGGGKGRRPDSGAVVSSGAGESPPHEASERGGGGGLRSSDADEPGPGDRGASEAPASPGPSSVPYMRFDMKRECRSVEEFERIKRISEGTYGVVYMAREKRTGRTVALKRIKMEKEKDGFPVTSVREINILLNFHHPNIVNVEEVVISPRQLDHIYMVMEYMDHDLKSLMEDKSKLSRPFSIAEAKCLMRQLIDGIAFLHANWVLHRDLKTSNVLYNNKGELKLCDFGMARQYGEPLTQYTPLVVTLWYRAPELLFGPTVYSTAVDMWSLGCIMAELLTGKPLFQGQGEFDQIDKMVSLLGTPTDETWPGLKKLPGYPKIQLKQVPSRLAARFGASALTQGGTTLTALGLDLLSQLLAWDPDKRISAEAALRHKWFEEAPLPQRKELMPMFNPRKTE